MGNEWRDEGLVGPRKKSVAMQENPESHVRSMDVETGSDADTPRPCGLALLLCMIERSKTTAEAALIGYASRLQVSVI